MIGLQKWIGIAVLATATLSCTEEPQSTNDQQDNFDRAAMLSFWADDLIIPAYQNYKQELQQFDSTVSAFGQNPSASGLQAMRDQFDASYLAWQSASLFEIGPAESRSLRNFTNIYPCDTGEIEAAIQSANYSLTLPSTFDSQGFPALDYLLFGLGDASTTLNLLSTAAYQNYLGDLSARLLSLASGTLQEWETAYRQDFIARDGSAADASVNKMANDYIFHLEKELRAGKVGIPAGVFSGNSLPNRVEAFYREDLSRDLFLTSLSMHEKFFAGISFDSTSTGPSLKAYLDYLEILSEGQLLSDRIVDQFKVARQEAMDLDPNFASVARNQNQELLQLFDALQQNVVWIKVDMMQALNIRIDYVDADGD